MIETQGVLLIFAKAPVAGEVKTRLIPELGQHESTSLYKELLTKTLSTAEKSVFSEIQLWISGDINHPYFTHLKNESSMNLHQQKGNDLGQRMFNAFDSALSKYPYAVLIGSDCPSMLISDLQSAAKFLEHDKDVVLGPAKDGGYYLIGLKKNNAEIFSGVNWGRETVFSETQSRIKKLSFNMGLLTERSDVDRVSDLPSYFRMKQQESEHYL